MVGSPHSAGRADNSALSCRLHAFNACHLRPARFAIATIGARRRARTLAPLVAVILAACGPELTTPSSTNISGTWTSSDTAAGVTDFVLVLSQASDGVITGSWSGQ